MTEAYWAVGAFMVAGMLMYKTDRIFCWYIAILYFAQLWAITSCSYIETGIYISEQDLDSFATGATVRLLFYNLAFFFSYFFMTKLLIKLSSKQYHDSAPSGDLNKLVLGLIAVSVILLYLNITISGLPVLSGGQINKFNFWREYAIFPSFSRFLSYSPFFGFALGFINFSTNDLYEKKASKIILCLFVLYQILEGHKFSLPYATISSFLIPYVALHHNTGLLKSWKDLAKIASIMGGIVIGILAIATVHASFRNDNIDDVFYRIFGLQGHVWWGADLKAQAVSYIDQYKMLTNEMNEIFHPSIIPVDTGIYFLTILLGGDFGYDFVVNKGGAYTMGYPAISLFMFGQAGTVILQIVFGILVSLLCFTLHCKVKAGQLISALLLFKLLWSSYNVLTMGNFSDLFNIRSLLIICAIILLEINHTVVMSLKKA